MILDVRLPNDIDVKISMPISVYFFFTFSVIHLCDHLLKEGQFNLDLAFTTY